MTMRAGANSALGCTGLQPILRRSINCRQGWSRCRTALSGCSSCWQLRPPAVRMGGSWGWNGLVLAIRLAALKPSVAKRRCTIPTPIPRRVLPWSAAARENFKSRPPSLPEHVGCRMWAGSGRPPQLARRPGHAPPAQDVEVDVVDGLSCISPIVDDHSVAA